MVDEGVFHQQEHALSGTWHGTTTKQHSCSIARAVKALFLSGKVILLGRMYLFLWFFGVYFCE